MRRTHRFLATTLTLILGFTTALGQALEAGAQASGPAPAGTAAAAREKPLLVLGPGDEVSMHVFGQPDMTGDIDVADNGTIQVPLAGVVHVAGLSPSQAALAIEAALRKGQYLVNPHVTLTVLKSQSQRVSILGEVRAPGIYGIQSNTTLLELLAQAGGETENGASTVYILRLGGPGNPMQRIAVDLRGLAQSGTAPQAAEISVRGGDQIYVPRAAQFYVTGNVHLPGAFRLDPHTTVLQAIASAGGVTQMGSMARIVIKRLGAGGQYREISARLTDEVDPNDVIIVKERIF